VAAKGWISVQKKINTRAKINTLKITMHGCEVVVGMQCILPGEKLVFTCDKAR